MHPAFEEYAVRSRIEELERTGRASFRPGGRPGGRLQVLRQTFGFTVATAGLRLALDGAPDEAARRRSGIA